MNQIELQNTVIVFDLDDTLYYEKDYQQSGFQYISLLLKSLYNIDTTQAFEKYSEANNILESVLNELKLPREILPSLIEVYRYHEPKIYLCDGVLELLHTLKAKQVPM